MAKIRIDTNYTISNGRALTFNAPADCSDITGLIVYYPDGGTIVSKDFAFVDSHGVNVGSGTISLFAKNAFVKVVLDVDKSKAYVQNADTNAYLESMFEGDQKPVYSVAAGLTDLTPGEKLSAALGKIAKAIKDLMSHLANKSNPHGVTKAQIGLGNVDNTSDTSKPVSTAQATAIADAKKAGTDAQTNLAAHNTNTGAHADIRAALDAITNGKVNVSDIVNNLASNATNKPLSAAQGAAIKGQIDALQTAVNGKSANGHKHTKSEITDFPTTMPPSAHSHTKSEITDFAHKHSKSEITDFPSSMPASDVYSWAKAQSKPTYTASEVGASAVGHKHTKSEITDLKTETWTFTLKDGTTVTKAVCVG